MCLHWRHKVFNPACYLRCPPGIRPRPPAVHNLHAPPRPCHQPARCVVSLLCRRHTAVHQDITIFIIITIHTDHLPGGDKGVDEPQLPTTQQLQNRSHAGRYPTSSPFILHNLYHFRWPGHSPLHSSHQPGRENGLPHDIRHPY